MMLTMTPWQNPPPQTRLSEGVVHLWRFPVDGQEPAEAILDATEWQRARRLLAPEKARQFIIARTRLRQILAGYLDCPPHSLRFAYGPAGKPALVMPESQPLAFNLAHSGRWGVCAVAGAADVGVDVDHADRPLEPDKLAARFFSASERMLLQSCPRQRRHRLFMRLWTRKEAWLKGKGGGFSEPDQDLGPVHLAGCCTDDGVWQLRSFVVDKHYLGALAVSRKITLLQRWNGWSSAD